MRLSALYRRTYCARDSKHFPSQETFESFGKINSEIGCWSSSRSNIIHAGGEFFKSCDYVFVYVLVCVCHVILTSENLVWLCDYRRTKNSFGALRCWGVALFWCKDAIFDRTRMLYTNVGFVRILKWCYYIRLVFFVEVLYTICCI